jgi:hypothetical protein
MTTIRPITDDELIAALRPVGPARLAGDVLEAVEAATLTQRQVSPWWPLGRRTRTSAASGRPDVRRSRPALRAARITAAVALLVLGSALVLSGVLSVPAARVGGPGDGPPASTPGFSPTGSMLLAREMVAGTTLLDGRVLVTGGWDHQDEATAELLDPTTGTFSMTGALPEPREGLTATLLPGGKVLVVGGYKYKSEGLATAWLWDPATGSFNPAGTLAEARRGHSAVLLPDGHILVVGGDRPGPGVRTAELWDPATRSFSLAGSSSVSGHLAAELRPDGRVLVVGDAAVSEAHSVVSAELWDPTTLAFSPLGSLPRPEGWDTLTPLPDGRVLLIGGCCNAVPIGSAVLWDPATSSAVPAGSLAEARWNANATLLPDGRVLVVGGDHHDASGAQVSLASAEVWDPATMSFSSAGSPRNAAELPATAVLPDGLVLVIGGSGTAEIWHP